MTYEFVVRSNVDEEEASMCLIGRRYFGDTEAGLKYEQWNNTGTYGATVFGVADYDFGGGQHPRPSPPIWSSSPAPKRA